MVGGDAVDLGRGRAGENIEDALAGVVAEAGGSDGAVEGDEAAVLQEREVEGGDIGVADEDFGFLRMST